MNPTIKLQENGTVTVTDTETTTTLSKVTVDEIRRLVKDKDKKPKPQLGKWYKVTNLKNGCLGFPDIGFFTDEKHTDGICGSIDGFNLKTINGRVWRVNGDFSELPPETVEQYLINEEQKRYGKKDKLLCSKTNEKFKILGSYRYFDKFGNWCHLGSVILSNTGQWATIIKPETITKAEAEKELGKVIKD